MKTRVKFLPIPTDIGDSIGYSEGSSTGLINKVNRSSARAGQEAGGLITTGYFQFCFRYDHYLNNRVVYFLCTGIDPEEKQVDHRDGDKLNNKISNLRLATNKLNQDNSKKRKDNTSGVTGVFWSKTKEKWEVRIKRFNKNFCLGSFHDFDTAVAVRVAAETNPRFRDQEYRHDHNDQHKLTPEMLEWAKQYLEDRIERLNWDI
jgi:hypothetical protein